MGPIRGRVLSPWSAPAALSVPQWGRRSLRKLTKAWAWTTELIPRDQLFFFFHMAMEEPDLKRLLVIHSHYQVWGLASHPLRHRKKWSHDCHNPIWPTSAHTLGPMVLPDQARPEQAIYVCPSTVGGSHDYSSFRTRPSLLTFQLLLSVTVRFAVVICHWTKRTRK